MRQEKGRGLKPPTMGSNLQLRVDALKIFNRVPRSRKAMVKFLHTYFGVQRNDARYLCYGFVQQRHGAVSYQKMAERWVLFVAGKMQEQVEAHLLYGEDGL